MYIFFKSLADPLLIIFVLLVIVFIFCLLGRRKKGVLLLLFAIVPLYGLSIVPTANYLNFFLEKDYLRQPVTVDKKIEAIVVLGGGANDITSLGGSFPTEATATRVLAGVVYFFQSGASHFVCSGKGAGTLSEAEVMAGLAIKAGVPKEKIKLEKKSRNTWEQAEELNKMFADKGIVLGLVTSAYHLKRSEREFKKYFHKVKPLPANFYYFSNKSGSVEHYLPQTRAFYGSVIALQEIFGQWWYAVKS